MSFLETITGERRADAARRRGHGALETAKAAAQAAAPVRDFAAALSGDGLALIAEVKRASPSKGAIAPGADETVLAAAFEAGGAAAISVLTEPNYFGGSMEDLRDVRNVTGLPVLRKDFLCDPLHVYEARAAGADAVLLIVAALTHTELAELIENANECGMTADVEVHSPEEVSRALDAGATVVAVNARNLATLEVDLATIERVRPLIPPGVVVVAESGIETQADVRRMRDAGVDAVHIGETLMRAADPAAAIRDLLKA